MAAFNDEKDLDMKIEMVKELLCKKIKGDINSEDIQEINECLNKLIINSSNFTQVTNF